MASGTVAEAVRRPDLGQTWRVDDWKDHAPAGLHTALAEAEWLHDWVLVQRLDLDAEQRAASPITLVKLGRQHGQKPNEGPVLGRVVAVGPGKPARKGSGREPVGFEAGARVLYEDYAAQPFEGDGVAYDVVRVHHVIAEVE